MVPPGQLPQRPPQILLRPMPVPPIIRPAVQPPIVEEVPDAFQPPIVQQPAEAVQPPLVEVPAVGAVVVQNLRDQRDVRRRGKFTILKYLKIKILIKYIILNFRKSWSSWTQNTRQR